MRKSCMSAPPARRMHRARPIKRGHFALGSRMAISHIINHNVYSNATRKATAYSVGRFEAGRRAADALRAARSEDIKSETRSGLVWSDVGFSVVDGHLINLD